MIQSNKARQATTRLPRFGARFNDGDIAFFLPAFRPQQR